jgi:uncharacterized membrane protein
MIDGSLLTILEPLALTVLLMMVGALSRRMGEASHAPPRYAGFFVGALLMSVSALARGVNAVFGLIAPERIGDDLVWVMLWYGLPAFAITLGLIGAWRYWSWLLAERA